MAKKYPWGYTSPQNGHFLGGSVLFTFFSDRSKNGIFVWVKNGKISNFDPNKSAI